MPMLSERGKKNMFSHDAAHMFFNALELIVMLPKLNKFIHSVYQYFIV